MKKTAEKIKNKGGRYETTLTDEQLKELEELGRNMTCEQIAHYFGMGESTFYSLKLRDERVERAYKKGKSAGVKDATSLLWSKMNLGDTTAIIFYLKTQAGWREKAESDNSNNSSLPPINLVVTPISANQSNNT